ncbi:hypothetical protein QQF64_005998 [Cirrhinus molitorella]|uniref:Uncharacterized protein n=1 Tax=Cirrhinus molitorella TaxID=172907 RepID=A0ABR3MGZ7_9TELE
MNMPLHQISVIPRDVTSSRVSSSGKAKEKDKQSCAVFKEDWTLTLMSVVSLVGLRPVTHQLFVCQSRAGNRRQAVFCPSLFFSLAKRPQVTQVAGSLLNPKCRPRSWHQPQYRLPLAQHTDQPGGVSPLGKESTAHLPVADNSSSVSQWKETLIPTALDSAPAAIADAVPLNDPK